MLYDKLLDTESLVKDFQRCICLVQFQTGQQHIIYIQSECRRGSA